MKKFIILIIIFCLPILLCWLVILLVDPCNVFHFSGIIDNETKKKMIDRSLESQPRGNLLWKTFEFKHNPYSNLIIGDSQSFGIKEDLISSLTGNKFYNFSIPGASIKTKFSIFWFAAKQTKLHHVIFQLSLINWIMNEQNSFIIVQEYLDNPLKYLINSSSLKDSFETIKYKITNRYNQGKSEFEFPISEKNINLFNFSLSNMFRLNYKFSENHFAELNKIMSYCKENDITVEFIILPIHQKYYDFLSSNNFVQRNEKFINDISMLSKTYNYSSDIDINSKEENFKDFFHQKQFITDSITHLIWGKPIQNPQ